MTLPQDPHLDVGAYLLGVLDPEDRANFEAHLASCPECAQQLAELGQLRPMLDAVGPTVAERPGPELLDRLVTRVSASRRRSRVRRLALALAASLLVLGGPAVTALLTVSAPVAAAQQFSAVNPANGVAATVGVTPENWGSRINLALSHLSGPLRCDLVAVSHTGEQQTVTTWSVPATGYESQALKTSGGSALQPAAIDHFEVRTLDGNQLLVAVPAHT